jgi:hypothetical protein
MGHWPETPVIISDLSIENAHEISFLCNGLIFTKSERTLPAQLYPVREKQSGTIKLRARIHFPIPSAEMGHREQLLAKRHDAIRRTVEPASEPHATSWHHWPTREIDTTWSACDGAESKQPESRQPIYRQQFE